MATMVFRNGALAFPGGTCIWDNPTVGFPAFTPDLAVGDAVITFVGAAEGVVHQAARAGQLPACCDCRVCVRRH
jgi:hypothetical protein